MESAPALAAALARLQGAQGQIAIVHVATLTQAVATLVAHPDSAEIAIGRAAALLPVTAAASDPLATLAAAAADAGAEVVRLLPAALFVLAATATVTPVMRGLLDRLAELPVQAAGAMLSEVAGLGSVEGSDAVQAWLRAQAQIAPVLGERQQLPLTQLRFARPATGEEYKLTELDPDKDMGLAGKVGLGSYLEDRAIYTDEHFISSFDRGWRRTLHLGIDLFDDALVPVFAPLDGVVESLVDTGMAQDYGPLLILRHEPEPGLRFYTLYGHLSRKFPDGIAVGAPVKAGQKIALLGAPDENGSWPPHLHFQLIVDLLGYVGNFPGVGEVGLQGFWNRLCPDPNLVLRLPVESAV